MCVYPFSSTIILCDNFKGNLISIFFWKSSQEMYQSIHSFLYSFINLFKKYLLGTFMGCAVALPNLLFSFLDPYNVNIGMLDVVSEVL